MNHVLVYFIDVCVYVCVCVCVWPYIFGGGASGV